MERPGGVTAPPTVAPDPQRPSISDLPAAGQLASLRCDESLRAAIAARLNGFARQSASIGEPPELRRAAVAIVVAESGHGADLSGMPAHAEWSPDAALILTRRPGGMRRHANQWALPGGRMDDGETAEQTALRELAEEVGLSLSPGALLGRIDDYVTRSGFVITPLVFWGGAAHGLRADPAEVESIHRIPVAELLRPDAPMLEHTSQGPHPVLRMPVGDSWIAAPTAALLYQFRELVVFGRPTRVAHFDQPAFAWT